MCEITITMPTISLTISISPDRLPAKLQVALNEPGTKSAYIQEVLLRRETVHLRTSSRSINYRRLMLGRSRHAFWTANSHLLRKGSADDRHQDHRTNRGWSE